MNSVIDDYTKVRVEYFHFEEDFMEDNIRCIPMIVRFKLDACGIKLKLNEWSKMMVEEREKLASFSIDSENQLSAYRKYLEGLISLHTGQRPTYLSPGQQNSGWSLTDQIPSPLRDKLLEVNMSLSIAQWKSLSILQRYALLKLTRPGHENKNFPKAMKEFGLA